MHKTANTNIAQKILSWTGKLISFRTAPPDGLAESYNSQSIEDGNASHHDQCCSGGYNEVFIFENWASYGPRH
jgi:hypothetical protein